MSEVQGSKMQGLTTLQAKKLQAQKDSFFHKLLHIVSEPMFLLLLCAAIIYFILGEPRDGAIMLVFVVAIISIEAVQQLRTDKTVKALRVLSTPNNSKDLPQSMMECNLQLCGLIGLADPPRDSIKQDIATCTGAGIRVVMITGDNGITASAIAKQIGMPNSDKIITGDELNTMSDGELKESVKDVSIFSRVLPEHKMKIVQAFQSNGEIVAMTGDGVNDAPALKYADIADYFGYFV